MCEFERNPEFESGSFFDESGDCHHSDGSGQYSAEEAGQDLADFLLRLKANGRLSARDVCVLSYYAKHAGAVGPVGYMAFRVDAPTGHYNRHLRQVLHLEEEVSGSYSLSVPGHDKFELERTTHQIPTMPPHEVLADEVQQDDGSMVAKLQADLRGGAWSECFAKHDVVVDSPGVNVWPVALYLDGFPFSKRDGALAFYAYNMISDKRHLVAILRRSQMCSCGCLGWCSLHEVLSFLAWSFSSLAAGAYPSGRHDSGAFGEGDELRLHRRGQTIPRMALVYIKADWAEFTHSLGMCSWQTLLHPCFVCWSSKDALHESAGFSPISSHSPLKTPEDYDDACASCEFQVRIATRREQSLVLGQLRYDKRGHGCRGRGLSSAIPELGLLAGDRLEPSALLRDVSKFEAMEPPFSALFWRPSNETICKHRCPLFNIPGVSLNTLAPDALHTLYLGVYKSVCIAIFWSIILSDALEVGLTAEVRFEHTVMRIRHELWTWYKVKRRERPGEKFYELSDFTPNMLGTATHRCLSTKAAETGTLLEFARDLAHRLVHRLGETGPHLVRAANALVEMRDIMRFSSRCLTSAACQKLVDLAKIASSCRPLAGIPFTPKWHLMMHCVGQARVKGNPHFYTTFTDEGVNGMLAKVCAACHRGTWHRSVFINFAIASKASRAP